jgi:hypothetical protein
VLTLRLPQVDLKAGTLRLGTAMTKNDDGRLRDLTRELARLLAAQVARVGGPGTASGPECPGRWP